MRQEGDRRALGIGVICYLIAATDITDAEVRSAFGARMMGVRDGVWVVATAFPTCADVAERLGMNTNIGRSGIVVRIGEYFGFYNRALWDKIEAWKVATA